ncbi:MAG: hypothetical protein U0802_03915 [Candidatus Binatia bacterium]
MLATLAERATIGGFDAPLGLIAIRHVLEDALAADAAPFGFLTGAVTLCELVPMRTVPFRVVALVGLSDGVFPRAVRPLAFDLMARHPQPGDRTPRDDDRYLFLEALLSAREHLLITYVGRSITDNAELPPSVVVSELLDAIDAAARPSAGDAARRAGAGVVHQHPLQPFSPSAFPAAGPLRSFARSQFAGAQALRAPRQAAPPFLVEPLPNEPLTALDLEALVEFFANPSRWLLRQRLQLQLPRAAEVRDDREPIELDPLARWDVGQRLLTRLLAGGDPTAAGAVVRAAGIRPLGEPGRAAARPELADAAAIAATSARLGAAALEPAEVELAVDGVRLTGLLRDRVAAGLLRAQFSRVGGRHELDLWIRHLVLSATRQPGATSVLVGRAAKSGAAVVTFRPVADPLHHLAALMALFRRGQSRPLPLFERASRAFANALAKKRGTMKGAIGAAEKQFAGDDHSFGDRGDAAVRLLFPQPPEWGDPATSAAAAVATAVFGPLLRHREET